MKMGVMEMSSSMCNAQEGRKSKRVSSSVKLLQRLHPLLFGSTKMVCKIYLGLATSTILGVEPRIAPMNMEAKGGSPQRSPPSTISDVLGLHVNLGGFGRGRPWHSHLRPAQAAS